MKQNLVDFLNMDLQFVRGVGPVLAARFNDVLGGRRVIDFMLHIPRSVRNRGITECVLDATNGDTITIPLLVKSHKPGGTFGRGRRRPTVITCVDKTGQMVAIQFFNSSYLDYWLNKLPVGAWRIVSGRVDMIAGRPTINHPDFIEEMQNAEKIPLNQAIYPSGEGLTQKTFANVRDQIFVALPEHLNGTDDNTREFFDALRHVHFPESDDDLAPNATYIAKLAYWELLAHQAAIVISRNRRIDAKNRRTIRPKKYDLLPKLRESIPFELTGAQKRTVNEIFAD